MASRRIVAVFDSRGAADAAREELVRLGLQREEVTIVDNRTQEFSTQTDSGQKVGFWAHLKEMFMPDEDRATLDECIRRGSFVLSASVRDEKTDEAIRALENAGAIDLDQRASEWGTAGANRQPASETLSRQPSQAAAEGQSLPVIEERLRVGKREVNRGSVRVRSFIVEEPVHEQVRLREERVEIERRPVNAPTRPVAKGSPGDLLQERTIEMSETAEQAVVAKEAVVTEEVRVRKTAAERVEDINETVRHTEVDVDDGRPGAKGRQPAAPPPRTTPRH